MDRAQAQLIPMRMWGYPTNVLKGNLDKLEAGSKLVYFIIFSKSTKEYQFYNLKKMHGNMRYSWIRIIRWLRGAEISCHRKCPDKFGMIQYYRIVNQCSIHLHYLHQLPGGGDRGRFYLWYRAMMAEMESEYSNQIWHLVDLFRNVLCWVQVDLQDQEVFNRLVAKGYSL